MHDAEGSVISGSHCHAAITMQARFQRHVPHEKLKIAVLHHRLEELLLVTVVPVSWYAAWHAPSEPLCERDVIESGTGNKTRDIINVRASPRGELNMRKVQVIAHFSDNSRI